MGNVLKDVYLNLDSRTTKFETDNDGIRWLNLSFNADDYHFFRRNSSFGGAVVSLEVLKKMGLEAKIMGSNIDFKNDGIVTPEAPTVYRYILVADETQVAYFTPSAVSTTNFIPPDEPIDYLFIDRSVELTESITKEIESFLVKTPTVKLIVYMKKAERFHERRLLTRAELVFAEEDNDDIPDDKLVIINEKFLKYKDLSEPITLMRPDLATHLSLYSTAAATIFGAFALGKPMSEALKLAHANVENSQLDKTLNLEQMEALAANYGGNVVDLALVAQSLQIASKTILDFSTIAAAQKDYFVMHGIEDSFVNRQDYYCDLLKKTPLNRQFTGVALTEEAAGQFTDDGRSFIDFVTDKMVMPGILFGEQIGKADCKAFVGKFRQWQQMGVGFLKWNLPSEGDDLVQNSVKFARCCLTVGLVPVIDTTNQEKHLSSKIIEALVQNHLDIKSCVIL